MANAEISLVVEKPEEKAAARNRHSNSEATMAKSMMKDEDESSQKWPSQKVESFFQKWKKIFVASCLFAVVLDPLFLYIPMMKDDIKCMLSDRNLKIAALLLRSLTDVFYIFDIIFQIYTSNKYLSLHEYRRRHHRSKKIYWRKFFVPAIIKTMWGSYSILLDILAILPLLQVAILIFFSKMRDLRSLNTIRMVIMNLFILLQYVPRLLRIYLSFKEFKMTLKGDIRETPIWIKGVLNFFMYILASHVFGAIWYFFAIQRVGICWHDACRKEKGCSASTFSCHDHHTFRNITFLNDLCPISSLNATLFDFGIYAKVLQSRIPGSTNYFQKFSYCFWLGLRHLSSLGSNLEPSINGWENLFVAFISIIGLLLFLYLIGNLQTYMQLDTVRKEAYRHNTKMEGEMKEKRDETDLLLSAIPKRLREDIKLTIMKKVRRELEEDRDAHMDKILSTLPSELQSHIKNCTPMAWLKQVPTLQDMDEDVLRRICPYLKPREFDDNSIIIEKGKPLEMMLFIVEGNVSIEKRDGSSSSNNNLQQPPRGAGEVCGEELLLWPLSVLYIDNVLTLATESATAIGHVEALVLAASDLWKVIGMDYFVGMMRRTFSAKEIEKATDNYQQSRIIREYEDATFYKVEIHQGNFFQLLKIVMKVQLKSQKSITKALKIVVDVKGVRSIDLCKGLVTVIGYGLDACDLANLLRKKLGYATIASVEAVKKPDDKTLVAVQKYTSMDIDVAVEAAVASQTNHINVVRFLGGCVEEEKEPALIFEYFPNGTLFEHIHKEEAAGSFEESSSSSTAPLSLELRLKIASETAGALAYLHSLTPPIIHLRLSTKHILLDDHYTAKLSAIGQTQAVLWRSDSLVNSISRQEYRDPHFRIDRLAEKSDVYSFGVVLAELLTSQKPAYHIHEGEEAPLVTRFLSSMEEDRLDQILDAQIIIPNEATSETAKKVADLAKRCLMSEREERPSMEQVAVELEGLRKFMAEYQRGEPSFSNRPTSLQP